MYHSVSVDHHGTAAHLTTSEHEESKAVDATNGNTLWYDNEPDVPTGLRPTGHAAQYQATGPSPTPPSPINQSAHNFQPANS
jgi:hypothetical protein